MKKRTLLKSTAMFFLSACMLLCVVVGLSACFGVPVEGGGQPQSTNEYYYSLDGSEPVKVSLKDVITLPTEVSVEEGDELIGWQVGDQIFKPGESVKLREDMYYPIGAEGEGDSVVYKHQMDCSPIIEAIVRPVYLHYFEDKMIEWEEGPLVQLRARDVINPFCLDSSYCSVKWKRGNRLDGGWLFLDKYNFEGWYLDEDYTKEFWNFSDIDKSNLGEELHLYAKWTYTGILYEEYDAMRWRVAEIDLSEDIEEVVIPSEYGRGKNCDYEHAGYQITGILNTAFRGAGRIGTLVLQSEIELINENFKDANIDCISLSDVTIPTYYGNSYTKVFDGYEGSLSCSADSDYEFEDGILYDKDTNEILWVSKHIPSEITLCEGVTGIYTFFAKTNIEKITLPSTVEYIEEKAFLNCANLKTVVIEGDVIIAQNAFDGCASLEYEIYKGGKYMGNTLMGIQEGATVLEVKDGCESIPEHLLENNETVTKVILPASVTSIGYAAFQNSAIEEIVISGKEFYFAARAFAYCSNLKTVTMPESTRYIGSYCFEDCVSLESIDLSGLFTPMTDAVVLDSCVFSGCTSLETVVMSENISKLYTHTFYKCTALQEINLPKNIIEIEAGCFAGCTSLKTVSMPGVTSLGDYFFKNCTSLTSVSIPAITSLGAGCFIGCSSLESIELPEAVSVLPESCFMNCTSLTSVSIPGITTLGAGCFEGCTNLNSLVLPSALTLISNDCFNNCSDLEYLFYLGNYKQWGYVDNKCSDIESKVYFYSAEVQTVENYIETRKACWGYDHNNVPTAWIVPTNRLDGKTFAMSEVSVNVSDYYWNLIVLLKESGQLESALGSDPDLYNAANTATTKQEFADNLGAYYFSKFSSHKLFFKNGVISTSQNGIDNVAQFSYLEINGEIVYSPDIEGMYYIASDSQIYEIQETEKISGNETMTITCYYSLVS